MNISITQQQAETILRFADAAVRAGGLQFARQAVEVMDVIDAAAAAAAQAEPVPFEPNVVAVSSGNDPAPNPAP